MVLGRVCVGLDACKPHSLTTTTSNTIGNPRPTAKLPKQTDQFSIPPRHAPVIPPAPSQWFDTLFSHTSRRFRPLGITAAGKVQFRAAKQAHPSSHLMMRHGQRSVRQGTARVFSASRSARQDGSASPLPAAPRHACMTHRDAHGKTPKSDHHLTHCFCPDAVCKNILVFLLTPTNRSYTK